MVNGLHLYSVFTIYFSYSPIHTHIHTPTAIGCHARYQPARQEQLGVRCLAHGHFDTPRVGFKPATLQLQDNSSYRLSHIAISPYRLNPPAVVQKESAGPQCVCNLVIEVQLVIQDHPPSS